ncbi:MAG: 16S rRNA (guanine(527)-N(7))-methyltransferase RsmG [Alphaproteobacteria bacterium]
MSSLTEPLRSVFEVYYETLKTWNASINLVGASTLASWDGFCDHHLADALALAEIIPPLPAGSVVVDMGSGAGIPGLLWALLRQHPVHLVEKNHKKASFLQLVAQKTGAPVTVHNVTFSDMSPDFADVLMARACAPLVGLLDYGSCLAKENAICYFLKGAHAKDELQDAVLAGWSFHQAEQSFKKSKVLVVQAWKQKQ